MPSSTDDLAVRRKQLRFRSWHRGIKEADLLLGRFADRYIDGFDAGQLDRFDALLGENDIEIYAWYAGRSEPPAAVAETDVWALLKSFPVHEASA